MLAPGVQWENSTNAAFGGHGRLPTRFIQDVGSGLCHAIHEPTGAQKLIFIEPRWGKLRTNYTHADNLACFSWIFKNLV
jgi:hypothetical protein